MGNTKVSKKIIIIIVSIVILVAIGGAFAYYMSQKPVKDFASSEAEIVLEAKDIYSEFVNDEIAANAKYVTGDKTIEVTGKIIAVNKNEDGTAYLVLDVSDPEGSLSCSLNEESSASVEKLSVGDLTTLRGQCTGFQELINKEVIMIRCGIVE
jgi:hypothetical protein